MSNFNILIADDMEGWLVFNQQNVLNFLKEHEVSCYLVKSAKEAYDFAFFYEDKIDLVITDLEMESSMEKIAGEWLIENLKTVKSTKGAKYLIISSSPSIFAIANRTDADGFLRKPSYQTEPLSLKYKLEEILGI